MSARQFDRLSNPPGPVHVAKAAGRFLEVGFKLVDGIAELPVARGLHLYKCLQKTIAAFFDEARKYLALEFIRSRLIAQQEPRIQKRGVRLHVRLVEFLKVRALPDLVAYFEVEIP